MKAVIVCKKADLFLNQKQWNLLMVMLGGVERSSFSCIPFFKWMVPWSYLP